MYLPKYNSITYKKYKIYLNINYYIKYIKYMDKAKLIVKNISKKDNKTIITVDSISEGNIKLYGVYDLANKFNVRLNNFHNNDSTNIIYSHPILNVELEIQLIGDYKKLNINEL